MALKMHEMPPVEVLRRYFRIDEHWRLWRKTAAHGWRLAAKIRGNGYFQAAFEGKQFLAHRIIWTLHYGSPPKGIVDHINGHRWDNRIENLREVTATQNRWNCKVSQSNVTGFSNVRPCKGGGYRAVVTADYRKHLSPKFDDAELAGLAAEEIARKVHGEFSFMARAA